jgi:hypothetical protein
MVARQGDTFLSTSVSGGRESDARNVADTLRRGMAAGDPVSWASSRESDTSIPGSAASLPGARARLHLFDRREPVHPDPDHASLQPASAPRQTPRRGRAPAPALSAP